MSGVEGGNTITRRVNLPNLNAMTLLGQSWHGYSMFLPLFYASNCDFLAP